MDEGGPWDHAPTQEAPAAPTHDGPFHWRNIGESDGGEPQRVFWVGEKDDVSSGRFLGRHEPEPSSDWMGSMTEGIRTFQSTTAIHKLFAGWSGR